MVHAASSRIAGDPHRPVTMSAMSEAPVTPLAAAVARVGDRWTMLLVEALLEGPRRFNDLIEEGQDLAGALRLLGAWGARHSEVEVARHEVCGTPMEPRWYCPTCAVILDDAEPELRFI